MIVNNYVILLSLYFCKNKKINIYAIYFDLFYFPIKSNKKLSITKCFCDLFQKMHQFNGYNSYTMSTVSKRIKEKHLKLKFILQMLLDLSRKMGLNINPVLLQKVTLQRVMKILFKIYRQVYSKLKHLSHHCTVFKPIENKIY